MIKGKKASKVTAILLAVMMAVVFMPTFAFAADSAPAKDITVYLTLSDQGDIAATKKGAAMAWAKVTVSDKNSDGEITFDEALIAAHDTYFKGGAEAGYSSAPGYVTKLWGKETTGCLFYVNGDPLPNGVTTDTVKNDDELTAAILKDTSTWSDMIASMGGATPVVCDAGDVIDITLTGRGPFSTDPFHPLEGVNVGIWEGAEKPFNPILDTKGQPLKTDANGKVEGIEFDQPGYYILTAKELDEGDTPIMAPAALLLVQGKSPMTVKANKVKASAKKTTTIKASKAFTVKKNVGTVTYKKTGGNKKITVSKAGKVTVKKGLKKGKTYTVTVKVTDSGNQIYKKTSKTVDLKVKIK